ncbi:MAG: MarR family winged helix-turn-helix transcriptional regulator [Lachnospiraceae bacterium]
MSNRYELLDMNLKLIWNFRDIGHTMRNIYEGKGSQRRILIILYHSGVLTQRELTRRLGIQPGSVSEVIGKLEASGLIVRTPSRTDHRTTDIALTEEGKAVAQKAAEQREERHRQMFSSLSEKEKTQLLFLLEKVNADWDKRYRSNDVEQGEVDYQKIWNENCRR